MYATARLFRATEGESLNSFVAGSMLVGRAKDIADDSMRGEREGKVGDGSRNSKLWTRFDEALVENETGKRKSAISNADGSVEEKLWASNSSAM